MMERVILNVDDDMMSEEEPYLTLHTLDGRHFEERVLTPLGAPENPMRDNALQLKFRTLAMPVLAEAGADRLCQAVLELERLDDARDLLPLLVPTVSEE